MKVVSIDFETANNNQGSVCAVGLCVLEDGVVEEAYYSLIHPPKKVDYIFGMNTRIHGIKKEDALSDFFLFFTQENMFLFL